MARQLRVVLSTVVGLALLIQLVPYGREHANPVVVREPDWSSARTRALFLRACKDCHSNETAWPWYSIVAPASWLVYRDVTQGRSHFNVSDWGREQDHGDEAAKLVREGEMPPRFYLPLHPQARLTDAERAELAAGLAATLGEEDEVPPRDHDHAH